MRCKGKGLYCKHIKAILLFEKLKNHYEIEATPIKKDIELILEKPQKELCPFCNSENLIKSGIRKTVLGEKQFVDGPYRDNFGSGHGEPYNPDRQAFGKLKDGRVVYCELSKAMQEKVSHHLEAIV